MHEKFIPKVKEALRELWYGPAQLPIMPEPRSISQSEVFRKAIERFGRTWVFSTIGADLSGDSQNILGPNNHDLEPLKRPLRILDYSDPRHPRIR